MVAKVGIEPTVRRRKPNEKIGVATWQNYSVEKCRISPATIS